MRCEEVREALAAARYGDQSDVTAAQAHVADCVACRAWVERGAALEAMLPVDAAEEPRPGFDTRMFARLEEARGKARGRTRAPAWMFGVLGTAALATAAWLLAPRARPPETQEDLALAADLELLEDLAMLQRLDEVEAFATLGDLNSADLDALDRGEDRGEEGP